MVGFWLLVCMLPSSKTRVHNVLIKPEPGIRIQLYGWMVMRVLILPLPVYILIFSSPNPREIKMSVSGKGPKPEIPYTRQEGN